MATIWANRDQMYVPTDGVALDRLVRHFDRRTDEGLIRIADFGCGAGECLRALHDQIGNSIESYGVELNADRAREAKTRLTHVVREDTMNVLVEREAFGLVNFNPPYDQGKIESRWLQFVYPLIQKGGIIICSLKQENLRYNICDVLARQFENLSIYKYPETEYNQVMIIGYRRQKVSMDREMALFLRLVGRPEITPNIKTLVRWQDPAVRDWVEQMRQRAEELPDLPEEPETMYAVPNTTIDRPIRFFSRTVDFREVIERMKTSALNDELQGLIYCKNLRDRKMETLMPVTGAGHFKALLDAGLFDGEVIRDNDGKNPLLITTGSGRKLIEHTDRNENSITHRRYEQPVSKLVAWTLEGELEVFIA